MITILRINHRILRDKRLTTHVCLTAKAFKAHKIVYSGQKDSSLETSIKKQNIPIEHCKNPTNFLKNSKEQIIHLTMKGDLFTKDLLKKINKNIIIIVGSSKVHIEYHKLANLNIAITKQPHSEVSALSTFLDHLNKIIK